MKRRFGLLVALVATLAFAGCLTDTGTDDPGDAGEGDHPGPATEWTSGPSVPTARTEVATAILEDELYVIGGFAQNNEPSATVEVLDLAEDGWRQAAALPMPLHHARALALDGEVHVFGGYNAVPFQATPTHLVYDPGEDAWRNAEPLPVARGGHGAAVVDGQAYLVGGVGPDGDLLAQVDVYDPAEGTYTQAADLPTPRDHLGVAATGTTVHAVGGREQSLGSNTGAHEVLAPGEGWTQAPVMPTARGGVDAANLAGSIVVAGGEGPEDTFAEVEAWNPATGNWSSLPALPTPRHGLGVDARDGELLTSAGGPEPGLTVSDALERLRSGP